MPSRKVKQLKWMGFVCHTNSIEKCHLTPGFFFCFFFSPPSTDVFHWSCLNNLASRLPLHTAPAGYQCPTCQGPVFPPSNLASPVADMLKDQLSSVNWARAGLGLPLVRACQTAALCSESKLTVLINFKLWFLTDWRANWGPWRNNSERCHWLHRLVNIWWWTFIFFNFSKLPLVHI